MPHHQLGWKGRNLLNILILDIYFETHVYLIIFFYSVVLKENVRGYTVVFSQMSSNKTKGVTQ